jgi:hypothetical protein
MHAMVVSHCLEQSRLNSDEVSLVLLRENRPFIATNVTRQYLFVLLFKAGWRLCSALGSEEGSVL